MPVYFGNPAVKGVVSIALRNKHEDIYGVWFTPQIPSRPGTATRGNGYMFLVPVMPRTTLGNENVLDTKPYQWVPQAMAGCSQYQSTVRQIVAPTQAKDDADFSVIFAGGSADAVNMALQEADKLHPERSTGGLSGQQIQYIRRCMRTTPNLYAVVITWAANDFAPKFVAFRYISALHDSPFTLHYAEYCENVRTEPDSVTHVPRDHVLITALEGQEGPHSLGTMYDEFGVLRPDWLPKTFYVQNEQSRHTRNGHIVMQGAEPHGVYRGHHNLISIT